MIISSWNVNSVRARIDTVSYTHLRAHETSQDLVCRLLLEKKPEADDLKFNNILIDKKSAELLKGSEVDFVSELIGDSFKISNPQSKSSCGCGVSFSL